MKYRLKYSAILMLAAGALIAGLIELEIYFGNFHEVIPGEFYRSAQLEPGDIARYTQQYHVRTVLNLRGNNEGSDWYDAEVREAQQEGVTHLNFAMSASKELTDQQAMQLIAIMRDAPKPLLVHCRSGADRTGLASALYVAGVAKGTEWQAERQMWIVYGHVPFSISAAVAMNRTFERLEPYLGFFGS